MKKSLLFIFSVLLLNSNCFSAEDDRYMRFQRMLQLNNDSLKCAQLIRYASVMEDSLQDYNFASLIYEKVNVILDKNKYPSLYINLLHNWAYGLYQMGNFADADKLYVKALAVPAINKDRVKKANILNSAGANLQNLGAYKRVLAYYNEALEIYLQDKDVNGQGKVYQNMANIFALSGDLKQSDNFFDKAKRIFLDNKMYEKYSITIGNQGIIKWQLGQLDTGKTLMIRSLKVDFKSVKDFGHYIVRRFNLGLVYAELQRWDSCFYNLERGKRVSDSLGMSAIYDGTYYYDLGYSYVNKGEIRRAISCYKKALDIKTGVSDYRSLYDNIAKLYYEIKQYDTAFIYRSKSLKIADSTYKSEMKEHIAFENKRLELLEKDYQNQLKVAEQQQYLDNLKKRNYLLISVIVILATLVFLLFLYLKQYKLKVKKEHLEGELDFLKAQLNPHFLFNSLNNIYVLLDENKEKASEVLLKFSDLMRYQLYDCNVSQILLSHEIQFLENYIDFEKLRYSNTINVEHNLKDLDCDHLKIAPILLHPFIENAFKHSPKNRDKPSFISINATLTGNEFLLEVCNPFNSKERSSLPGGIGLENVKKRLKLLYAGKHELKTTASNDLFKITLKITLSHD